MRIELHPMADAEFAAQVEYYDDQQQGLGRRFYGEVIGCLDWIARNPTLARLRKNYRRVNLQVFPFYIATSLKEIWSGFSLLRTATESQAIGSGG